MPHSLRIIYAGTPEFAVPALNMLSESRHEVLAVYTQPDRPAGRGRRLAASPVKQLALQKGIAVEQPESLKTTGAQGKLAAYAPDLMVVAAYGLILPKPVLLLPRLGCVNIHASLLPAWRGAAPIHRALLAGDRLSGITLMQMDEGLDTGGILATEELMIGDQLSSGQLHDQLALLGAELLKQNLDALAEGRLTAVPQDHTKASYANKIDKSEAWMDWSLPAEKLALKVRAFNPWPVAQTKLKQQVLRIWQAQAQALAETASAMPPGSIVRAEAAGIDVVAGKGCLRLLQVQLPGGKVLKAADFINAHHVAGEQLQ